MVVLDVEITMAVDVDADPINFDITRSLLKYYIEDASKWHTNFYYRTIKNSRHKIHIFG